MTEILPLVDKTGIIIGQAPRAECHASKDLIHPVILCWIFNDNGEVLCQQRSLKKDIGAGDWDIVCGGHIKLGSSPEQTVLEELEEELGITDVSPVLVGNYLIETNKTTEFAYVYFCIINKDINEFTIQLEEVEQVKWEGLPNAIKLFEHSGIKDKNLFLLDQLILVVPFLIRTK